MVFTTRDVIAVGTSVVTPAYGGGSNGTGSGGTADKSRAGVWLCNVSSSGQVIYVLFDTGTPSATNYDIQIKPGEAQPIDFTNPVINLIASAAAGSMVIREYRSNRVSGDW
jgi:hypothetical protein